MSQKNYTRVCIDCGKVMVGVGCKRRRCEVCAKEHERRKAHEDWAERHSTARAEAASLALIADNRRLEALGGSYGKGRLKEYLDAQKSPPVLPAPESLQRVDGFCRSHHPDDITKSEVLARTYEI